MPVTPRTGDMFDWVTHTAADLRRLLDRLIIAGVEIRTKRNLARLLPQ